MDRFDFSNYVSEYQAEGVGDLLYGLLLNIVTRCVKRYPPTVYSPNGVWDDDAISGLCHDFTIGKLLKGGWLEHYLLALETVDQLRHSLERDFRHFLVNHHQRTEFQNLVQRTLKMLRENPTFKSFGSAPKTGVWGLSTWGKKRQVQNVEEVVHTMYKIALPPLVKKYRIDSRKLPHLLRNESLYQLLEGTFSDLDACIGFDLLVEAMRYRLNLYDVETLSLDEPMDPSTEDSVTRGDVVPISNSEADVGLAEIAHDIYTHLSLRQRRILASYQSLDKPTLEQIGLQLGVSKSTVGNDLKQVQQHIVSIELAESDAEAVFRHLYSLCTEQHEEI